MSDAYFYWLIELVGDGFSEICYQKLLWKLFSTPFYYELDYDKNRAIDGLFLRRKFYQQVAGMPEPKMKNGEEYPCSVLEMMIALARQAEDNLTYDPDSGDSTGPWFWVILRNLELNDFDDCSYNEARVDRILTNFMHHNYAPDGTNGSAFPCPGIDRDMRKTDLWWQLGAFFMQNFQIPIW